MTWNYRVVRTADEFVICEAYYQGRRHDRGIWTEGPAIPAAETLGGPRRVIDRYREALAKLSSMNPANCLSGEDAGDPIAGRTWNSPSLLTADLRCEYGEVVVGA